MTSEGAKIRAEIDNRTVGMLQAASGGGVISGIASLPRFLELAPSQNHYVATFIALNVFGFSVAICANVSRRFTSQVYNTEGKSKQTKMLATRRDWTLVLLSSVLILAAY